MAKDEGGKGRASSRLCETGIKAQVRRAAGPGSLQRAVQRVSSITDHDDEPNYRPGWSNKGMPSGAVEESETKTDTQRERELFGGCETF